MVLRKGYEVHKNYIFKKEKDMLAVFNYLNGLGYTWQSKESLLSEPHYSLFKDGIKKVDKLWGVIHTFEDKTIMYGRTLFEDFSEEPHYDETPNTINCKYSVLEEYLRNNYIVEYANLLSPPTLSSQVSNESLMKTYIYEKNK